MFTDVFEEFLGHGIFVVDGEQWRQQRKTASFMFSHAKLTQYMYQTCQYRETSETSW